MIRTWTLRQATDGALCAWEHKDGLSEFPGIEVVELAPVLDLLEKLRPLAASGAVTTDQDVEALEDQEALLRTHGRLR